MGEKNLEYFLPFLGDEVRPEWGIIGDFIVYYDENEELTAFLNSEGFSCAQSDPVYTYPIDRALVSKKISRIMDMASSRDTLSFGELRPEMMPKIRAFWEQKSISSSMLDSGSCHDDFSFVYIKDGNIMGVLLAQQDDPDVYLNLLLTDEADQLDSASACRQERDQIRRSQ